MPSSYNAPYSFALNPTSQGTGWTNLSEYLSQANMNAIRGMNSPVVFQPGVEPYDTTQAADFDNWLFSLRPREPWDPNNVSNFPPETPKPPEDTTDVEDKEPRKRRSDDDYRDRFPPERWQPY